MTVVNANVDVLVTSGIWTWVSRGAISRWTSTGAMERYEDLSSTSYCVAIEIIPWVFYTDLNDKHGLAFVILTMSFSFPSFPVTSSL